MDLVSIEKRKEVELISIKNEIIKREYNIDFFNNFNIGNVYVSNKYSDNWDIVVITEFDSEYIYIESYEEDFDSLPRNYKKSHREFVDYYAKNYFCFKSLDEAKNEMIGKSTDELMNEIREINSNTSGGDSGLVDLSNGSFYKAQINELTKVKETTDILFRKHKFQVDVLKNKLWQQQRELESFIINLNNKLETFNKMISTLEAYQTAKDNIFQISSGKNSKRKTIHLYKKILYADEEYGKPSHESIDIFNIHLFFDYLKDNYHDLVDEKSVTMFSIRRNKDKHYSDNPYINAMNNEDNQNTFLVFRNGENIHILDTENRYSDLYPSDDFMLKINEEIENINNSNDRQLSKENQIEKIKQKLITEHKKLLMLEAILMNTEIFDDRTSDGKKVSLLNEKCVEENLIKYVDYVDLVLNTENRPLFSEYLKTTNNNIKHGSRIYLIRANSDRYEQRYSDKFEDKYNYNEWTRHVPHGVFSKFYTDGELPKNAIGYIKVEIEYINQKLKYFIYNHDEFINYDSVTVDDIDYYLVDRFVRRNYMRYMQYLLCIEDRLREEKAEEEQMITLMINTLENDGFDIERDELMGHIEWWKNKTKEFRFLLSDDEKAWRMILKRIKNN